MADVYSGWLTNFQGGLAYLVEGTRIGDNCAKIQGLLRLQGESVSFGLAAAAGHSGIRSIPLKWRDRIV